MKHLACKVRQRFTLIIVCAIRQNEVASAPGTAEASARWGQAAPGREAARGSSHGAVPAWAGMLEAQWGMPDNLTSAVSSASSCCSPSQPKLLGVCTPHAPSQPCGSLHSVPTSGCPQGCSQTSAPSVCLDKKAKPLSGGVGGPQIAPAHRPLGTRPQVPAAPRSGEGNDSRYPPRDPLVRRSFAYRLPKAPNPPHRVPQPYRWRAEQDSRLLETAHQLLPFPKPPFACLCGDLYREGKEKQIMML